MRITICGDSFMAQDNRFPGQHFSELFDNTFEIINLAVPGVSNTDICYQLKESIGLKPDYVIIGTTDCGRIEMPYHACNFTDKNLPTKLSLKHFRSGPEQIFVSNPISRFIAEDNKHSITDQQKLAVKLYLSYMFFPFIVDDQDDWMLNYWYYRLKENNIKYNVLSKDFCIYEYAKKFPHEEHSFHTDFATQELAAKILTKELIT